MYSFTEYKIQSNRRYEELNTTHPKPQLYRLGLTNGCFDILHAGHVEYLEEAKSHVDFLIVGLNSDDSVRRLKGFKRPINKELSRARVLAGLQCVDYVAIFDDTSAEFLIKYFQPDIYFKGGDYSFSSIPENEINAVALCGGKIKFMSRKIGYSTSDIIAKINES